MTQRASAWRRTARSYHTQNIEGNPFPHTRLYKIRTFVFKSRKRIVMLCMSAQLMGRCMVSARARPTPPPPHADGMPPSVSFRVVSSPRPGGNVGGKCVRRVNSGAAPHRPRHEQIPVVIQVGDSAALSTDAGEGRSGVVIVVECSLYHPSAPSPGNRPPPCARTL